MSSKPPEAALPPGTLDRAVRYDDADQASALFSGLYRASRIDIQRDAGRFDWDWKLNARTATTLIRGRSYAGAVSVTGNPTHFGLSLVSNGAIELMSGKQRVEVVSDRSAGILNAGEDFFGRSKGRMESCNILIDADTLASHAAALVGAPVTKALRFDATIDLRSELGVDLIRLVKIFVDASDRSSSPLGSPHVMAHLREALCGALLLGQPNTVSERLHQRAPSVNVRAVRDAAEILAARATEPITIAEVAKQMGIGLRSLERAFKSARGQTLREFLKEQRLDLAHRRLRAATPGMTVTQILYASGFSHPGEFSREYRRRFGEAPSQTLQHATR